MARRRGHGDPFSFRRDPNAAVEVPVGDQGRKFSIPSSWAEQAKGRLGLTDDDIGRFGTFLAGHVRDGGDVPAKGFLGWLDERLSDWRDGIDDERRATASKQAARDFIAEQERIDATLEPPTMSFTERMKAVRAAKAAAHD